MTQKFFLSGFLLLIHGLVLAQKEPLPSSVFEYKMIPSESISPGAKKDYVDWSTLFFSSFQVSLKTISSNSAVIDEDLDPNSEKLIIIKQGKLGIEGENFKNVMEERSVVLIPQGKNVKFSSETGPEVTYFLIQWKPDQRKLTAQISENNYPIEPFGYHGMEFKENAKGGRRSIRQDASSTLKELEMHITTLNEGEKSHDPHTHLDEEIILILEGEVEEMINGTPYMLGPGSLIFLASMDPHGIRNSGKGTCEYYAIRFTPLD
ncbi:MAG TPA: cupin domain-containing protein [Lunatimonas sp.]|nr:cupin domain-containing protein [Lunatimonas sp.]